MNPENFDPAYLVTLDEIYHCHWVARKRGRIARLHNAVDHFWPSGHPTRLIHISGTNGKGSVAHYLEQGLRFAGATGSWTGPHVFDYAERLHINAQRVEHAEIVEIYRGELTPYLQSLPDDQPLGFPEIGILLCLHLFVRHGVRWGMMESGVGGRYTPLMALPAEAAVVTNVGNDHPISLGSELWQRALEKAGCARPEKPFFTAATGAALDYVVKAAEAEGADVHAVNDVDLTATTGSLAALDTPARVSVERVPAHVAANLTLALKLIRYFYPERSRQSLLTAMPTRLPARFWTPEPGVVVDVAHNRDKIEHFVERLALEYPTHRFLFLVGLTRKRDPVELFAPLFQLADEILVTSASYPGQDPDAIAALLRQSFNPVTVHPDPRQAYRTARDQRQEGQILVLTGSAYMIDQALNPNRYLRHLNASFGWRGRIGERV
ncbi:MAG: hypothetical protein AAF560_08295 [Acidobacteriota bacterium]